MSRTLLRLSVLVVLAILVLVPVPVVAQDKDNTCQDLRLLLQARLSFLPYQAPTVFPDFAVGWTGIVRGFLGTDPVNGILYYTPPDDPTAPPPGTIAKGQSGHEGGGRSVIDLGPAGKFVTEISTAVFQLAPQITPHMAYPPPSAFGHHSATVKIDPKYNLYGIPASGATGNLSFSGFFLVNGPPPVDMGIWNSEINGRLCIPK
jgi:hypothetical protein